jgi:hypothetical protein
MTDNTAAYLLAGAGVIVLTVALWLLKKFSQKVNIFLRDTLKEKQADGYWKWSRTSLTMASAWYAVLYSYFFDLVKNGFHMEAFIVLVGVATGVQYISALSKKVNPLVQPPKEDSNEQK